MFCLTHQGEFPMRREPWGSASWQDRPEPPPFSPGDQLLGYGVTAAGIAGGLVWATGQVAGLAFGHTWLHVDPAELAAHGGPVRPDAQHAGNRRDEGSARCHAVPSLTTRTFSGTVTSRWSLSGTS